MTSSSTFVCNVINICGNHMMTSLISVEDVIKACGVIPKLNNIMNIESFKLKYSLVDSSENILHFP